MIGEAENKSQFCRDWRNRFLAHNDLTLGLNDIAAIPLEQADHKKINEALEAIAAILNTTSKDKTNFNIQVVGWKGAKSLLHLIKSGLKTRNEMLERLKNKTLSAAELEDLQNH